MTSDDPDVLAEVTAAFRAYEVALGENDIDALDTLFWNAPQTVRYGVGENLYGHAAIARFRRDRPGGSPPRTLVNTVITTFGHDAAAASTEFMRIGGGRIDRQTQTWVRTDQGWRIAAAHVSLIGDGH